MKVGAPGSFGAQLKALREAAGFTQEELATIAGLMSGILAVRRGNPDKAVSQSRQTLRRVRELKDRFAFVHALLPLALAASHRGHHAQVARILGAQAAITESTGVAIVDRSGRVLERRRNRRPGLASVQRSGLAPMLRGAPRRLNR